MLAKMQKVKFCKQFISDIFINNEFIKGDKFINVINPSNGENIGQISVGEQKHVDMAVQNSIDAFNNQWKCSSPDDRQDCLWKIGEKLQQNHLETLDSGKPITQSKEDMNYCIQTFKYFSSKTHLQGRTVFNNSTNYKYQTIREPMGVVGLITPWNYPLMQAVWKLAPALAFGNTCILKPSEYSSLTCIHLGEIVKDILPKGVLNIVPGDGNTGNLLTMNEKLDAVNFTGSTQTGQKILENSSKFVRKSGLELGGKSPVVVFKDSDLDKAVEQIFWGCYYNMGQNCVASTRVLVQEEIYEQFLQKIKNYTLQNAKIGNPLEEDTNFGPLNNQMQYNKFNQYLNYAKQNNLEFLIDQKSFQLPQQGYYCSPIILRDVPDNSKVAKEEIFGPFLSILKPFKTKEEALQRANDSKYGLGAGVFTQDMKTAEYFIRNFEAGSVWVNFYNWIPIEMPFGGYKQSGFSKEVGEECIDEYTKIKSVYYDFN